MATRRKRTKVYSCPSNTPKKENLTLLISVLVCAAYLVGMATWIALAHALESKRSMSAMLEHP